MTSDPIFTVGHSSHPLEEFLGLLSRHRIAVLADVRSAPYSRFNPQFNREGLAGALAARGVEYACLGRELGGRPDDPACYADGRVSYERTARTSGFRAGLARLAEAAAQGRVALMCAEKEPLDCHRTLLVAHALDGAGVRVSHILADGSLESHRRAMDRLAAAAGLDPAGDLFRTREETVAQAVALRSRRVAFAGAPPGRAGG